ncbi:MAG: hypothetical protein IT344_08805 [Candidatus Dadabacteria bacterium]|nr:hypothetical protein [Candidatus Dadabacteria bacterium]
MSIKTVSAAALLVLLTFLHSRPSPAWGGENAPPGGCAASGFRQAGGRVILNPGAGDKEGVFLLHNVSGAAFQVTHPVKNPGASAGWTSEIGPGRWSAFAAGSEDFALVCVKPEAGETKTLPCEGVLKVCELTDAQMPADLSGSFWVSEDKELKALLEDVKSRGISRGE